MIYFTSLSWIRNTLNLEPNGVWSKNNKLDLIYNAIYYNLIHEPNQDDKQFLPSKYISYMQKVLMYISFFHHPVYYTPNLLWFATTWNLPKPRGIKKQHRNFDRCKSKHRFFYVFFLKLRFFYVFKFKTLR